MYLILLFMIILFIATVIIMKWNSIRLSSNLENEKNRLKCQFDCMCQWLRNENDGCKLRDMLYEREIHTIAIYGKGNIGRLIFNSLKNSDIDVLYFIDKNAGRIIDDLAKTVNIADLCKEEMPDAIIVSLPYDFLKIKNTLLEVLGRQVKIMSLEEVVYKI